MGLRKFFLKSLFIIIILLSLIDLFLVIQYLYFYKGFKDEIVSDIFLRTYVLLQPLANQSMLEYSLHSRGKISPAYEFLDSNIFFPLLTMSLNSPLPLVSYRNSLLQHILKITNMQNDSKPFKLSYVEQYPLFGADLDDTSLAYLFLFKNLKDTNSFLFNLSFLHLFEEDNSLGLFYTFTKNVSSPYTYDVGSNIHLLYYCQAINCSLKSSLEAALLSQHNLEHFLFRDDFYDCSFKIYRLDPFFSKSSLNAFKKKCYEEKKLPIRWLYIYSGGHKLHSLLYVFHIFVLDITHRRHFFYVYQDRVYENKTNFKRTYIFSKAFENAFLCSLLWEQILEITLLLFVVIFFYLLIKRASWFFY